MQERNRFAFKEWAVVCESLDSGMQSLILRKGGIHEGREGFHVEHSEFWLFPTDFHQQPEVLSPAGLPLLDALKAKQPAAGIVPIRNYVAVEEIIEIRDEPLLERLSGLHIWSESTLQTRFRYRTPMLFALLVRVYRLPEPKCIPESPHFAGCRSWVDFPTEIETANLSPVLTDEEHATQIQRIRIAMKL